MKLNIGDSLSVSGPSRSPSAIVARGSDPKIDDFKRLSLDHDNTPGVIPRKRPAGVQLSTESRIRGETKNSLKSRRPRGSSGGNGGGGGGGGGVGGSGGTIGRDVDFDRGTTQPLKKLYDPNTHTSAFGKSFSPQASRSPDSRTQGVKSRRDPDTKEGPPRHPYFQPPPSREVENAGIPPQQQFQAILNCRTAN